MEDANKGLKFIFEDCQITLSKPFKPYDFHDSFRFEFHNCKFISGNNKFIKSLLKIQTWLYQEMDCCESRNFELCVSNDAKNERFEVSAKPELDQSKNDDKNLKTLEELSKSNP